MRAVIFANGVLEDPAAARQLVSPGDLVIAADGGGLHCLRLGITPHLVIGDFDSLERGDLEALAASGAELVRYPARKDFTDLELALQQAVQRGGGPILVVAALGNRWDQTLANLLLPAAAFLKEAHVRLVDGPQEVFLIHPGTEVAVEGAPGDTLSLVPLSPEARGIRTENLEYPLKGESLYLGSTRGVSNVLAANSATISLEAGMLLCVLIHQVSGGKE